MSRSARWENIRLLRLNSWTQKLSPRYTIFFESQLIFNSESRHVCQLSYLHQISAVENEEWKILESRTEKGWNILRNTWERRSDGTAGETEREGKSLGERERERERGEVAETSAFVTLPDKCPVSFRGSKNQSDELYVPLQDTCSFGKVAKVWAATRDRNLSTYLPQSLHMVSGAHKASYSLDNGWNVIWSKTAGAWSWRVTPFIYEVMEEWSHNCLLPIYLYDIHRQNFTVAHGI